MVTTRHTTHDDEGRASWHALGALLPRDWWQHEDAEAWLQRQHELLKDDRSELQRYEDDIRANRASRLGIDVSVEAERRARLGQYADEFSADPPTMSQTSHKHASAPQAPQATRKAASVTDSLRVASEAAASVFSAALGLPRHRPDRPSQRRQASTARQRRSRERRRLVQWAEQKESFGPSGSALVEGTRP